MDDLALGRLLRAVRVRRRLRQCDLAATAGVSQSTVSRIERGSLDGVPIDTLRRVCAVIDVRVTVEPRGEGADLARLADAKHAAMHEAIAKLFRELPGWVVAPEVSFSIYGERGVIDILAWHAGSRSLLVIEIKTELANLQETLGTLDRKVRLAERVAAQRGWRASSVSTWLVIADSSTNRRHAAAHGTTLGNAFPHAGPTLRSWLRDPTGRVSAMSYLSGRRGERRAFASVRRVRRRPAAQSVAR